jgi:hypothetical protein
VLNYLSGVKPPGVVMLPLTPWLLIFKPLLMLGVCNLFALYNKCLLVFLLVLSPSSIAPNLELIIVCWDYRAPPKPVGVGLIFLSDELVAL